MGLDHLKRDTSERVGEPVLFFGNIYNIIHNLGGQHAQTTIRERLRPYEVKPRDFGMVPSRYGASYNGVRLYRQSGVWSYLQELNTRGEIRLQENGVADFDDIAKKELDRPPVVNVRIRRRKNTRTRKDWKKMGMPPRGI